MLTGRRNLNSGAADSRNIAQGLAHRCPNIVWLRDEDSQSKTHVRRIEKFDALISGDSLQVDAFEYPRHAGVRHGAETKIACHPRKAGDDRRDIASEYHVAWNRMAPRRQRGQSH